MSGTRLLALVLGFWVLMRAVNKDAGGRTLIDRLVGNPNSVDPLLSMSVSSSASGGGPGSITPGATSPFTVSGGRVSSNVTFSQAVQAALRGIGNQERTDSGLDFGAPSSGRPVPAVLDGTVVSTKNWGGGYAIGHAGGIVYRTAVGDAFVMEDFAPAPGLKPGDRISAGQTIGTAYGQIETGWANPAGTNALQGSANPTQSGIGFTLAGGFHPIDTAHNRVPGY